MRSAKAARLVQDSKHMGVHLTVCYMHCLSSITSITYFSNYYGEDGAGFLLKEIQPKKLSLHCLLLRYDDSISLGIATARG